MSPRKSKTDPELIEMPPQKMAVVQGTGTPDKVFPEVMPALYGSAYSLKFDLKKRGLPTFKVSLPQKVPAVTVRLETWDYGTVAQILHIGAYDQEGPTIERLHRFIEENGYEITGAHEEEYLTRPDAKVVKTLIRYVVKKKA
jgi:hypothetical protein